MTLQRQTDTARAKKEPGLALPPPVTSRDALRPARGIIIGLLIAVAVWAVIALGWWLL